MFANRLSNLCVVLCAPSHPGNIGAAARAMKTMGVSDLRLVNPEVFPSDIATARASGATDVLDQARVFSSLAEALADTQFVVGTSARNREFVGEVLPLRAALTQATPHADVSTVALVFGTEMSGMTNEEVLRCHTLAYIPSNPDYSSLNLGAAVQVACYEWRMLAEQPGNYAAPEFALASQQDIERFYAHMETTMTAIGFFNPDVPKRLFPRLRRLFSRTRLEKEEVDIFRGFLRSVDALTEKTHTTKSH
jgi:tRNA/rRNA methyltransferase